LTFSGLEPEVRIQFYIEITFQFCVNQFSQGCQVSPIRRPAGGRYFVATLLRQCFDKVSKDLVRLGFGAYFSHRASFNPYYLARCRSIQMLTW
jgi:hypothetical protein